MYAQAFVETAPDVKKFLQVVEKNGDLPKIDKIVVAIEERATRQQGGHLVHIEVARATDLVKQLKFGAKDQVRVSINPSLVAGVRITVDGTRELDNSFKRKINNLWHTNY